MQACVEAYTTVQLERAIGVRNDRIRERWLRYLRYRNLDPERFKKIRNNGRVAWAIPKNHLPAIFREMTDFTAEEKAAPWRVERLKNRSVIKGQNWGVLLIKDRRGRPVPAYWEVKAGKLRAGFMSPVYRRLEEELKALLR